MHSYIEIFNFTPTPEYRPLESLAPIIRESMLNQKAAAVLGEGGLDTFALKILECMQVYYRLVGINEEVIAGKGSVVPQGILPRFTEGLIHYFQALKEDMAGNKEIAVLQNSGITTIKIRYKYTESVIKKLVKLGLNDPALLDDPLSIFMKGGALHDLIGMLFICSSPYEREWAARALYSFFDYEHRTDDHLLYGFYSVKRKSGYRGLHCDHTRFYPRFDTRFKEEKPLEDDIFELYDPVMSEIEILDRFRYFFNIEIQLHTAFENLWAGMEHRNSYNIQAKGAGRSEKIAVQWNLLSDTMKNLEIQFERLQVDTEQARFDVGYRQGYTFVKNVLERLDTSAYQTYLSYVKKSESLETLLKDHEISRQGYVEEAYRLSKELEVIAKVQNYPTVKILFLMQSAFMHYGLANHRSYFNSEDIYRFVQEALRRYLDIYELLKADESIYKCNLLMIIVILRYHQLAQQYGLGLIHTGEGVMSEEELALVNYATNLRLFKDLLTQLNELTPEELSEIKNDDTAFLKMIHRTDVLAREWELLMNESPQEHAHIDKEVARFRTRYVTSELLEHFKTLLENNKIKNVSYLVKFYTTLVWHGLIVPLDALVQIIHYSAYDKIKTSDLFYYELAAYKFLVVEGCESMKDCSIRKELRKMPEERKRHFGDFHRKNMIRQIFKIYKNEPHFTFLRAKFRFEQLTTIPFKMDHFSETITNT
ncbi:hypothetical protein YH65_02070 [Sulfurovum lithotrophicum]|uniref:Uncharacterized protein n=1 Tax=Sulfurovum lithotrophicum TaxID=206403 RepID=A0A7U4RPZ0_9BACT|nr:hypothetical protein [Sulfurovum lithotrophicum]AKF24313.1 hypothetical protein YH65_02070 [Sulfurovum lithotrophicum]